MSKIRSIIERRIREAQPEKPAAEELPTMTPFETLYEKVLEKIEKKSLTVRLKLYKLLLEALVKPLAGAGSNRTRLTAAAREFLRDLEKLSRS